MTEPDSTDEPLHRYAGDGVVVEWRPTRCEHSGNCVRGLPAVFDTKRRPWIDATAADADAIERQVWRCPSGALRVTTPDGAPILAPDR